MKIGMNLFLWTTDVTPAYYSLIPRLKHVGYEAVEVPIARADRANYAEIRKVVDDQGLACTTMFNLGADLNPISPDSHRGTLGTGMVDWVGTVKALKRIHYDNWIMVESFANDVPPLSQLAHVWRNCFESKDEVYRKGITFVRDLWNNTNP